MLYPQKLSSKNSNILIKSFFIASIVIAVILIVINKLTTPEIHWAALANSGIIYAWLTVWYSISKNTNIAGHVMIQTIAISLLTTFIDYRIGFKGWSLEIAIPIIIIVANVTMLILTIVSHKKYIRYSIYQLVICLFSLLPLYFIYEHFIYQFVLSIVAIGISILNFLITIVLCAKDVKEAVVRKFHF